MKYFFPTLFGMLCIALVTVADGIFVGHGVGSDGIAAVNICVPLLMVFTGVGLMGGVGCSVVASIHLARKKVKVTRLNVTQSILFVTFVALLPTIVILLFPGPMARLLGSSQNLLPLVTDYLFWFAPSLVFLMWDSVGLFIIRLDGAPRLAMSCSVIAAVVNVLLDWWFIFPLQWGVMGAALASTLSIVIGGLIALCYLLFFGKSVRLLMPKWSVKSFKLSLRNIGYQIRIGSSALLGESTLAMLMFMGNITFMYYMGDDGVGAFGIACYYIPFVFMVGNAIAQSAQPIISYNFGRQNIAHVRTVLRISLLTAFICGLLATLAFLFMPARLIELFISPTSHSGQIAIYGLPLFASGFIFFICNLSMIGYYQSVERVLPATVFALLRGAVYLVPSFLLLPRFLGNDGIWLAMPLSELLTTATLVFWKVYTMMRNKKVAHTKPFKL